MKNVYKISMCKVQCLVSGFLHLLVVVNDLLNHGGLGEGADVTEVVKLVGRDLPQYPAHYLTRSGLGQSGCDLGSSYIN